jgi:hypothetical protein
LFSDSSEPLDQKINKEILEKYGIFLNSNAKKALNKSKTNSVSHSKASQQDQKVTKV